MHQHNLDHLTPFTISNLNHRWSEIRNPQAPEELLQKSHQYCFFGGNGESRNILVNGHAVFVFYLRKF